MRASGLMHWERANPTRISPGEFVWKVRRQVEDQQAAEHVRVLEAEGVCIKVSSSVVR